MVFWIFKITGFIDTNGVKWHHNINVGLKY